MESKNLIIKLGICPANRIRNDIPDYLTIALNWYMLWEEKGEDDAFDNYNHCISLAEEFGLCVRLNKPDDP